MSGDAWERYADQGRWYYEVVVPGYKYNMNDVQAALGLRQLERLDAMQARRREIVDRYDSGFSDVTSLRRPVENVGFEVALHLYPLRVGPDASVDRNGLIEGLTRRNIGTSVHFIPLHLHPYYRDKYGLRQEDFPVAQAAYSGLVTLPLHPGLTDEDVTHVVESVRDVLGVGQE